MVGRQRACRGPWLAYYSELGKLAAVVMRTFALALDLRKDRFNRYIDRDVIVLHANHHGKGGR